LGAVFVVIAAFYVLQFFLPDPFLSWAAVDEDCCHVPTILRFQQRGLIEAAKDYPSATTPLYHIIMATAYGRVPDIWLRVAWVIVTLGAGWLLYRHVLADDRATRSSFAASAIAIAFLMNPTVRAAAVFFVTDGLPLYLTITSLFLLRRTRESPGASSLSAGLALVAAHASFYARQYYVWVPLYVTHSLVAGRSRKQQAAVLAASALLLLPALGLLVMWGRTTPPMASGEHTYLDVLVSGPTALAFVAIALAPAIAVALRDLIVATRVQPYVRAYSRLFGLTAALVGYVGILLAAGFEIPVVGNILRTLAGARFGGFGTALFLVMSYAGLAMLVRFLVLDGTRQLWWLVFLLPFMVSGFLSQRYFDPVAMLFFLLVACPRDAARILNGPLVWYYPAFSVAYSVGRLLLR
jgi:hypothetical protein